MGSHIAPAGSPNICTCRSPPWMAISQIPALTAHISFLLWELIFGRPRVGRSTPPSNGNFTDSCSDSSYFIPTLRANHLADQVLADLPPDQMAILQIPTLTAHISSHISFLLWELNIWQTRSWQIYPHLSGNFTDSYSDNSYFIPTLRAYHLADQVLADLPPIQWWFYRFLKFWQLTTLRAQSFGRPVLGRCNPPHQMANSQIPVTAPTLRAHIWQTECWQINPPSNGNFTDCCSDSSYFIPTLTAQHLADQVLADLPPLINGNFTDSFSTLRAHIWQTKCWQIYPHIKWQFHRFLWNSYFIPTLRAHHLADQVLTDLPPIQWWFYRFLLLTAQ